MMDARKPPIYTQYRRFRTTRGEAVDATSGSTENSAIGLSSETGPAEISMGTAVLQNPEESLPAFALEDHSTELYRKWLATTKELEVLKIENTKLLNEQSQSVFERSALKQETEKLKQVVAATMQSNQSLQESVSQNDEERRSLKQSIVEMSERLQYFEEVNSACFALEKEKERAETALEDLKQTLAGYHRSRSHLESVADRLQSELKEQSKQIKLYKEHMQGMEQEIASVHEENESLRSECSQMRDSFVSLEQERDEMERSLRERESQLQYDHSMCEAMHQSLVTLEQSVEKSEREKSAFSSQLAKQQYELLLLQSSGSRSSESSLAQSGASVSPPGPSPQSLVALTQQLANLVAAYVQSHVNSFDRSETRTDQDRTDCRISFNDPSVSLGWKECINQKLFVVIRQLSTVQRSRASSQPCFTLGCLPSLQAAVDLPPRQRSLRKAVLPFLSITSTICADQRAEISKLSEQLRMASARLSDKSEQCEILSRKCRQSSSDVGLLSEKLRKSKETIESQLKAISALQKEVLRFRQLAQQWDQKEQFYVHSIRSIESQINSIVPQPSESALSAPPAPGGPSTGLKSPNFSCSPIPNPAPVPGAAFSRSLSSVSPVAASSEQSLGGGSFRSQEVVEQLTQSERRCLSLEQQLQELTLEIQAYSGL